MRLFKFLNLKTKKVKLKVNLVVESSLFEVIEMTSNSSVAKLYHESRSIIYHTTPSYFSQLIDVGVANHKNSTP